MTPIHKTTLIVILFRNVSFQLHDGIALTTNRPIINLGLINLLIDKGIIITTGSFHQCKSHNSELMLNSA